MNKGRNFYEVPPLNFIRIYWQLKTVFTIPL